MKPTYPRIVLMVGGLIALTAPLAAPRTVQAQQAPTTSTSTKVGAGKVTTSETTKASAKIVSIDKAQRTVLLRFANGKVEEITAGSEVKNFDQLKAGQTVHASYTEALSLELKKTGATKAMEEHYLEATAPVGSTPGAAAGRRVSATAEVVAINQQTHKVTLRGKGGKEVDLQVDDPERLKNVKIGDHVEAIYTEAVALTVEPAG